MIVVRQIDVFTVAAEGELQDAHAGKTEVVAQGFNIGRDDAQVFSDDRQLAQCFADRCEQFAPRRCDPLAALRSLVAARYLPARSKPAKVIYAQDVELMQHRVDAFDPPTKTFGAHALPVVQGIAPELARLTEIVGRHACDDARAAILV